jgi:hypothetical protein
VHHTVVLLHVQDSLGVLTQPIMSYGCQAWGRPDEFVSQVPSSKPNTSLANAPSVHISYPRRTIAGVGDC